MLTRSPAELAVGFSGTSIGHQDWDPGKARRLWAYRCGRGVLQGFILTLLLQTPAAPAAEYAVYRMVWSLVCFPHVSHSVATVGAWPSPHAREGEMTVTATSSDRFRHVSLFYRGRGEYLAALRGLIQASRARGDAVFVAVPKRNAQLVHRDLGNDSAHVTLVDMAELGRNPARIIPALLTYAGKHRGQHVCCIDEPIWPGRTAAEMQE